MKKLSGLLLLILLLFSVTITVSAIDRESVNPFEFQIEGTIETTISQNMGGVFNYDVIDERTAALAESILCPGYNAADMTFLYMVSGNYINSDYTKVFVHPAVLGIC